MEQQSGSEMVNFNLTKEKLNGVGCGFCLAKWTQVTMHLHNGTTHSCHHPEPHKVSVEEVNRNFTALHNSKVKKFARKQMLEGERPSECQYCWNVEDNSNSFSDRIFKSSEPWSEPHFEEIKQLDWRENYNPKYVEVNFSNTCNFKCAYCGPEYSTKWMEEINEHGGYKLATQEFNTIERMEKRGTKPFKHSEFNPYVEAFWGWWPDLYHSLDTFRITGGEPLLSKDTWKVLDYILETETPNKNLKLSINSNLGVPDELIDRLIQKLDRIIKEERVKEVVIFTSCEGYEKQAEYTRYGLDFDKLISNIDKILLVLDRVTIVMMSTFNLFSVFSYERLIKKVYELKRKHFTTRRYWNSALILDTSYLRHPPFMSFRLLKGYIDVEYFNRWIKYMKFNSTYRSLNFHEQQTIDDVGFSTQEIEKITRIRDIFVADYETEMSQFDGHKKDFIMFIEEYEKRRGMNCEEYYPELIDFIKKIKDENKL
jgi:organic radical activating enzyme